MNAIEKAIIIKALDELHRPMPMSPSSGYSSIPHAHDGGFNDGINAAMDVVARQPATDPLQTPEPTLDEQDDFNDESEQN